MNLKNKNRLKFQQGNLTKDNSLNIGNNNEMQYQACHKDPSLTTQ